MSIFGQNNYQNHVISKSLNLRLKKKKKIIRKPAKIPKPSTLATTMAPWQSMFNHSAKLSSTQIGELSFTSTG